MFLKNYFKTVSIKIDGDTYVGRMRDVRVLDKKLSEAERIRKYMIENHEAQSFRDRKPDTAMVGILIKQAEQIFGRFDRIDADGHSRRLPPLLKDGDVHPIVRSIRNNKTI